MFNYISCKSFYLSKEKTFKIKKKKKKTPANHVENNFNDTTNG